METVYDTPHRRMMEWERLLKKVAGSPITARPNAPARPPFAVLNTLKPLNGERFFYPEWRAQAFALARERPLDDPELPAALPEWRRLSELLLRASAERATRSGGMDLPDLFFDNQTLAASGTLADAILSAENVFSDCALAIVQQALSKLDPPAAARFSRGLAEGVSLFERGAVDELWGRLARSQRSFWQHQPVGEASALRARMRWMSDFCFSEPFLDALLLPRPGERLAIAARKTKSLCLNGLHTALGGLAEVAPIDPALSAQAAERVLRCAAKHRLLPGAPKRDLYFGALREISLAHTIERHLAIAESSFPGKDGEARLLALSNLDRACSDFAQLCDRFGIGLSDGELNASGASSPIGASSHLGFRNALSALQEARSLRASSTPSPRKGKSKAAKRAMSDPELPSHAPSARSRL